MQYVEQRKTLEGDTHLFLVSLFQIINPPDSPSHVAHRRPTSEAEIAGRLTQKAIVYDGSDHRIQDGKLLDPWQTTKP
jgi:hypothetical protein